LQSRSIPAKKAKIEKLPLTAFQAYDKWTKSGLPEFPGLPAGLPSIHDYICAGWNDSYRFAIIVSSLCHAWGMGQGLFAGPLPFVYPGGPYFIHAIFWFAGPEKESEVAGSGFDDRKLKDSSRGDRELTFGNRSWE
jgi:hypothetical protein